MKLTALRNAETVAIVFVTARKSPPQGRQRRREGHGDVTVAVLHRRRLASPESGVYRIPILVCFESQLEFTRNQATRVLRFIHNRRYNRELAMDHGNQDDSFHPQPRK